jgi:signal peptidase I
MDTQDTTKTEDITGKKRNPWTAAMLSFIQPGLGHVYCGCIVWGIAIIFAMTWLPFVWAVGVFKNKELMLHYTIILVLVSNLIALFAIISSYRIARRTRHDYQLKDYNKPLVYIALVLLSFGGVFSLTMVFKGKVAEAFSVPFHSMTPTIQHGDRVIANKLAYKAVDPARGDISLFKNPDNRKQNYIKRVVALAGDELEIKNSELFINGEKIQREFIGEFEFENNGKTVKGKSYYEHNDGVRYKILITEPKDSDAPKDFGPVTVPKYSCFVLGDNRNMSRDSRAYGSLQVAALRGRFEYLYFTTGDKSRLGNIYK